MARPSKRKLVSKLGTAAVVAGTLAKKAAETQNELPRPPTSSKVSLIAKKPKKNVKRKCRIVKKTVNLKLSNQCIKAVGKRVKHDQDIIKIRHEQTKDARKVLAQKRSEARVEKMIKERMDVELEKHAAEEIINFKSPTKVVPVCDGTDAPSSSTQHSATNANDDDLLFNYTSNITPKSKPNPKSIYKKRKILQEQLNDQLPGYEIVQKKSKSIVEEDANLAKEAKFTRTQIDMLSKTKKSPSYPTIMKNINQLLPKIPPYQICDTEKRKNLIFLDFYDLLVARFKNMKNIPARTLRVTVAGDTGEKSTKLCFYFNDVKNPQSCYNYTIFAEYEGDDSRENLVDLFQIVDDAIKKLKDGVVIKDIKYFFKFFVTGDLKFMCSVLGCQGGSSKKFCCFCKSESYLEAGDLRSITEIEEDSKNIKLKIKEYVQACEAKKKAKEEKTKKAKTKKANVKKTKKSNAKMAKKSEKESEKKPEEDSEKKPEEEGEAKKPLIPTAKENDIKKSFNSVSGSPLIPSIPIENYCPPALHCCMALCNKLRVYSNSDDFDNFINDLNLKPIQGRNEFDGNACRKILQKFRMKPDSYLGSNKKLFVTISNIELMAKAETLKESEINLLENLIKELIDLLKEVPDFSIGNKIHCILFHLLPFVKSEKSWGLFSEQGMEAIHAKFKEFQHRKIGVLYEKSKYAFYEMLMMTFVKER